MRRTNLVIPYEAAAPDVEKIPGLRERLEETKPQAGRLPSILLSPEQDFREFLNGHGRKIQVEVIHDSGNVVWIWYKGRAWYWKDNWRGAWGLREFSPVGKPKVNSDGLIIRRKQARSNKRGRPCIMTLWSDKNTKHGVRVHKSNGENVTDAVEWLDIGRARVIFLYGRTRYEAGFYELDGFPEAGPWQVRAVATVPVHEQFGEWVEWLAKNGRPAIVGEYAAKVLKNRHCAEEEFQRIRGRIESGQACYTKAEVEMMMERGYARDTKPAGDGKSELGKINMEGETFEV